MNPDREFADQLGEWLTEGPANAPDRVLETVLVAFPAIRQGRGTTRVPWTLPPLRRHVGALTAVAAAAALVAAGIGILVQPSSDVGRPASSPTASPSASPTPSVVPGSVDTSGWPSFASARHGFTVRYPTGWQAARAEAPWTSTLALQAAWDVRPAKAPMLDTFTSADGPVFGAASQPLPPGMSSDAWLAAHEAAGLAMDHQPVCWPAPADMARTTVDDVPAWVSDGCGTTEVIAFTGGRVYIFTSEIDPNFNRPIFDAFLSTVRFAPSSARDAPASPVPSAPSPS